MQQVEEKFRKILVKVTKGSGCKGTSASSRDTGKYSVIVHFYGKNYGEHVHGMFYFSFIFCDL